MNKNTGVSVSGGSLTVRGNMAVGNQAKIIQSIQRASKALDQKSLSDITARMDALVKAISTHTGDQAQKEELLDSTRSVAEELVKPKPNKINLIGTLTAICGAVKSATGIAVAAEALKAAVIALI